MDNMHDRVSDYRYVSGYQGIGDKNPRKNGPLENKSPDKSPREKGPLEKRSIFSSIHPTSQPHIQQTMENAHLWTFFQGIFVSGICYQYWERK